MNMRRNLTFGLTSITLIFSVATFGDSVQGQDIEQTKHAIWRVDLTLNAPNLVPPAVQWTILDANPVPDYADRVEEKRSYHQDQVKQAKNEAEKELERGIEMTMDWNLGFKVVTGDQVYLLTSAPGVSHSLSSNTADGKKWIVTKIVRIKQKPVCWCLPIEVKTGEKNQVTLTEKNTFDLESTFDEAMRGPSRGE